MKLLLTLSLISLFLVGCTKSKVSDVKELNLLSVMKVSGFDPALGGDMYTSAEMGKVYEGLYEFHPTKRPYELMPNVAEALPEVSKDGLTYTFKIKKGVMFRDDPAFKDGKGRELKASDVVFSIKRLADLNVRSRGWWLYDDKVEGLNEWRDKKGKYEDEVSGLKALDDHTLQVKVKKPYPQLLYAMAMPFSFIVAPEAVNHYGNEFINHPVGTGAFMLNKYEQSNTIVYHKNPNYREKYFPNEDGTNGIRVPGVDKITVHIILESQPQWLQFKTGKLDISNIPKDFFEETVDKNLELKGELKEKGVKLDHMAMLDVGFYAFNHEDKTFKDVRVRRAMSLAYERSESNRLFYNNTAMTAQGVIPPGMGGYDEKFENPWVKFDVEQAKKLLAEAGYPEGKGFPEVTVQTVNDTEARQGIEFFAKCMARIGIKIKIGTNTWPELVNKVSKKQHQMYVMAWAADYPDAENFLGLLYCPYQAPGSNGSNYCNPKFDEMFRKSTIMQDGPERSALYREINQMVSQDVPWIFGFHRTKFTVTMPWVRNYNFMEFNHSQYQYLSIDVEAKKKEISKF